MGGCRTATLSYRLHFIAGFSMLYFLYMPTLIRISELFIFPLHLDTRTWHGELSVNVFVGFICGSIASCIVLLLPWFCGEHFTLKIFIFCGGVGGVCVCWRHVFLPSHSS